MNLTVPFQSNPEVKKTLFKLKPIRRDGLILSIHYTKASKRIRFVHCCFHQTGHSIAAADNDGHFYIIDFFSCKFWGLPKLDSCTFIKYSSFNQDEILFGIANGDIYVIDCDTGNVTGKLQGHRYPVKDASFAQQNYCLSASQHEAIIWDLQTNSKIQVLTLEKGTSLKQVVYMPISNNILACFQDDLIQVWNNITFDFVKQFLPLNWNSFSVRNVSFSRNGQVMIVAGYLPTLAIFLLDRWKLSKLVTLPEYIHTIKSIEFIPQYFDGGSNKILAILAGQGIIYFYDVEENIIISELSSHCEIIKFECGPNGTYLACVLCSGEIELYNLNQYIAPPVDLKVEKVKKSIGRIRSKTCVEKIGLIKDEISNVLDIEKLKAILKEYGEYPEIHRIKIWEKLLQLPNNIQQYNSIINHVTLVGFKDLYTKYPLESTVTVKGLKKLLNNVVTWCPFFAHVDYLPVFAFPFVKVFQNKPVTCFEAFCTIILNFCQHWFEYFPLPPMNILAVVENMLMEHDPSLLHYLSSYEITASLYAWALLETAFSEVLTSSEWLLFWDHVFTNEPSFLLCAVVSYNIIHRNTLLTLQSIEEFEFFYHNQNPNDIKKFINKTYYILNNTSEKINPRQYLEMFRSIEMGNYPLFIEYPKTILDLHEQHVKGLNTELLDLDDYEAELIEQAKRKWRESNHSEIEEEENRRQEEMNKANMEKIKKEEEKVQTRYAELQSFRKHLDEQEKKIFCQTQNKLSKDGNRKQMPGATDKVASETNSESERLSKIQTKFIKRYAELLKYKYRIGELINKKDQLPVYTGNKVLRKYQQKLEEEIDKLKKSLVSTEKLKKLNIATSVLVMEKLIKKVESELQQETTSNFPNDVAANMRIKTLQMETEGLEKEVSKLLKLMSKSDTKKQGTSSNSREDKCCCCAAFCDKAVTFNESQSNALRDRELVD